MPDQRPAELHRRIDLGAIRSSEGYFLTRPASQQPFLPGPQPGTATWHFCSTFRNNSPPTLRDTVLDSIRAAQRKVFITSYILGDDELIETLAATADRLTGGVYVIVELSETSLARGLAALAGKEERGQEITQKVEAEKKRFISLTSRGVAVRGHENCHAKFMVTDDELAWLGSANLETRAFTKVGEVGVLTTEPSEVARLTRLFAHMWLLGSTYELPSTSREYNVHHRRERSHVPFKVEHAPLAAKPSVLWTTSKDEGILHHIHDIIRHAKRRLVLATWSLNGMDDRRDLLINPIRDAIARGVQIDLLARAMNERDRHRRDAGLLHKLGVNVVGDDLNHAKAVVADNQHGALFSANFDAQHGLDAGSGIEVGARLDGTPALPELAHYLQNALDCATRAYVDAPESRQLHDALDEPWQHPWPLSHEIVVLADPQTWAQLTAEPLREPVLWAQQAGRNIDLLTGRERFRLQPKNGPAYQLQKLPGTGRPARDQLAQWWKAPSTGDPRGFCPATLILAEPSRPS